MINRRKFLFGSSALLLSSSLSACTSRSSTLQIALLKGSLPLQLISSLSQQSNQLAKVKLKSKPNLQELYDLLLVEQGKESQMAENKLSWKLPKFSNPSTTLKHDVVTLGNYWLQSAIQEQLIEPLQLDKLKNWQKLSPSFQQLVNRDNQGDLNNKGKIWGAPYRWGCTMIAYRNDKFKTLGWQPTDWHDLWNKDIQHRFSLLNQPREVIGLTLKKLGYSYNSKNPNAISDLEKELKALHQLVKFYDSQNYLQPLILGDTWLAVGWSTDILPIVERYHNLSAIVPQSGTALWADMWVKPKPTEDNSNLSPSIYEWIDFCWQPKSMKQINLFTKAMSTIEVSKNISSQNYPMTSDIFDKSEFIEHLPQEFWQNYQNIWQQLSLV